MLVSGDETAEDIPLEEQQIKNEEKQNDVEQSPEIKNDKIESLNNTVNETRTNNNTRAVTCKFDTGGDPVKIVNGSELIKVLVPDGNVTSKDVPGDCIMVLFYARYCTFSSMAAPHFNALPRAFPDIKFLAIDAMKHHIFNAQNGIVGVPTLILFHNSRPVSKFNDTEYTLELFSRFISKWTNVRAKEMSYVTSADFAGPVPSTPEKDIDYFLVLSWLFIIICAVYYFTKSSWWKWIVEMVQNTWRESEAQHEHND